MNTSHVNFVDLRVLVPVIYHANPACFPSCSAKTRPYFGIKCSSPLLEMCLLPQHNDRFSTDRNSKIVSGGIKPFNFSLFVDVSNISIIAARSFLLAFHVVSTSTSPWYLAIHLPWREAFRKPSF